MYLLDTNILSEVIRTRPTPSVANRFETAVSAELFTSVICLEEIRFVTLIGPPGNRLWERTEAKVLNRLALLPIDRRVALLAASLRAEWKTHGTPVGYRDGLIAATAQAHGLVLVTRNTRHFDHMTGLKLENWFDQQADAT